MTIEAKLRITAIVDQAVKALRQVSAEAGKVNDAAKTSGDKPFVALSDGAKDAATAVKQTTAETQALRDAKKAADAEAAAQALAEKQRLKDAAAARAADAKAAADAAKQKLKDQKATSDAAAAALRQQRNEARQLAPQLTDIVVGLSTGQSPFTVLLQQGGQLKDVFGGVGNAAKALASIFTTTRVVVGGLAAAIGLVAFEAIEGARESDALNKNLALTGNIAGTSAGQLDAMAKQISTSTGKAIGDVRATLTGLVSTGQYTGTTLESAGRAAVALSKLTGETAADTIKQFDGMADGVAAFAAKSNQAYNFLTVEQFQYIQSLEAQGRTQEAMKVTLDALASTMEQRSVPAIGSFERAWNKTKETLSGVLDYLKSIGRDTTPEERIAKLRQELQQLSRQGGVQDKRNSIEQQIADAQRLQVADQVRAAERASTEQETQDKILKASKAYQDALAGLSAAGAQEQLANTLAGLDKQQGAIALAHASGLQSELQYNVALNRLDQQRLQAQAATLQRQIEIEAGKTVEKPQDVIARDTQVKALTAQLTQVRGQISQAAAQGRAIVAADALDDARTKATEWAQIWQQAYEQIRQLAQQNAAAAANGISDPVNRAAAEASAQTADLSRQVAELQRQLELKISLTVDPGQRAALQNQVQALAAVSKTAIDEGTRKGLFASYSAQLAELQTDLQNRETAINQRVAAGQETEADGEQQLLDLRKQQIPNLERILELLQAQASTPAEQNQVAAAKNQIDSIRDLRTELEKTADSSAVSSISTALSDIETGAKPAKAALLDMVGSFAKAMLDVLNKRLAQALVNQFEQAAQGSNFGGLLGFLGLGSSSSGAAAASTSDAGIELSTLVAHTGAVVGGAGGSHRRVAASAFDFAPRFHTGGIAGLKPNERAVVVETGEEILTANNPRHQNNFTGGGGDLIIPLTVSGVPGDTNEKQQFGEELTRRIKVVALDLLTEQSRQGGILAKRS